MDSTFRTTIRLLRYRPILVIVTCLAWGAFHSMPLVTGLITREIFNALSGSAPTEFGIQTLLVLLVVTSLTRVSIMVGGIWSWASVYFIFGSLLRHNVLAWIVGGAGTRRLPSSPGEAVSRFRDDVEEVLEWIEGWTDFTGTLIMALVALIIMYSIDPLITTVVMLPLAGIFAFGHRIGGHIRKYRKANREATGRITSFIGEVFGSVQAVKVASAEERVLGHFGELNDHREKVAVKDALMSEIFRSVNANMVNIGTGVVLLLGADAMQRGTFSIGDFALFVFFLQRLTWSMFFFGDMIAQHRRAGVSFERLGELLVASPQGTLTGHAPLYLREDPPAMVAPTATMPGDRLERLDVVGLRYIHPSTGRGIHAVDLTVKRGEFVVVTGRIGSGKSTLLRCMLGLLPRDNGTLLWNGIPVSDPAAFLTPPRAAYTAQVPRLFSDSLRDNIMMGHTGINGTLDRAIDLAIMGPDVHHLEHGLDTQVGPRGVKLSGGQVQRSAAARMFAREPELLVFDDLSSALDTETEQRLWDGLFEQSDCTCIVASHRHAALRRADRIVVLKDGYVEDTGTLDQLFDRCKEMRHLWSGDV